MVEAPGKLVLAGEYAVLFPKGLGLVLAVLPGIQGRATPRGDGEVHLHLEIDGDRPLRCRWEGARLRPERDAPAARFALGALEALGAEIGPFGVDLSISRAGWEGAPAEGPSVKPGLGGSGASVACALAAACHGLGVPLPQGRRVALGLRAHRAVQGGVGSGIDVAASTLGGVVRFEGGAPEADPILRALPWPGGWPLGVIFSGVAVATAPRVRAVLALAGARPRWMAGWTSASNGNVEALEGALIRGDYSSFCRGMEVARALLLELGDAAGLEMEGALAPLISSAQAHGVAKQSGAGGGDSALLFPWEAGGLDPALNALREKGFQPLDLTPAPLL